MSKTCTTPHNDTSAARDGLSTPAARERACWPVRVYRFYRDGFKSMTVGRTLWAIIGIKLIVFFVILRLFELEGAQRPGEGAIRARADDGPALSRRHLLTHPER